MTDAELEEVLKSAHVPAPPRDYWERLPHEIVRRLRHESSDRAPRERPRWSTTIWGIGFAAACLAIGLVLGVQRGRRQAADNSSLAENSRLIREVAALFPNRVRAIISDESAVRLVLADQPDVPTSVPLVVKVCQGEKCQTVITFSGQEIQVANENVEVLADARGIVWLIGERFIWSSAEAKQSVANVKIEARAIEGVL